MELTAPQDPHLHFVTLKKNPIFVQKRTLVKLNVYLSFPVAERSFSRTKSKHNSRLGEGGHHTFWVKYDRSHGNMTKICKEFFQAFPIGVTAKENLKKRILKKIYGFIYCKWYFSMLLISKIYFLTFSRCFHSTRKLRSAL